MRGNLYKDYKTLQLLRETSVVKREEMKKKELKKKQDDDRDEIERLRNRKRVHQESTANYREYVLTELTATALRAIYMSAVTETTVLTRESKIVGDNMAINYIRENGGVYNVLNKMEGTYFLERLRDIIYEAAEDAENKKNEEEEKKEAPKEEPKEEKEDTSEDKKSDEEEDLVSDMNTDDEEDTTEEEPSKEEEKPSTDEGEEKKEDTPKEEPEKAEAPVDDEPEADDIETPEDSGEEEDITNDTEEDVSGQDLNPETKEEMLDKLEQEEDTDTAIDIIAQRISKAEEEFIKKNAQDKQKIEDIVDNINDRINGAKADPNNSDEDVEEIEQEAAIEMKRKISKIRDDRPHTVFEMMVRQLSEGILNDTGAINEEYTDENGKINMDTVVEVAKCVYGFLEFVNTCQLERVDEAYVKHVIESI